MFTIAIPKSAKPLRMSGKLSLCFVVIFPLLSSCEAAKDDHTQAAKNCDPNFQWNGYAFFRFLSSSEIMAIEGSMNA
jgi:hypothetical protein